MNTMTIIKKMNNGEITKKRAIEELQVLLDNSTDIPDRINARAWEKQLIEEKAFDKKTG